jgi:co-chaperonin GroES (HSP10)
VNEKTDNQHNLNGADYGICSHKMRPVREGDSVVIEKYQGIDCAMNDQKADQKQTRERDQQFFSD